MEIKNYIIIILLANIGLVQAQYTAIPDSVFEQKLINQGIDSDGTVNGYVLTSDINSITYLSVGYTPSEGFINDLTGIEGFTALENLDCHSNLLEELHLENNIALKILNFSENVLLTDIDISQNINLEYIDCS